VTIEKEAWDGGGNVCSDGRQGSPQRETALPTEKLEERVRRGQGRSSFWSGGGSRPGRPRDRAVVVGERYPLRSLDDWLGSCVLSALAGNRLACFSTMIIRKSDTKSNGVLTQREF